MQPLIDLFATTSTGTLSLWLTILLLAAVGIWLGGWALGRRDRAAARAEEVKGRYQLVEAHHRVNGPERYRHRPVKTAHPTYTPGRPAAAVRRVPTQRQAPRSEVLGRHAVETVDTHLAVPAVQAGRHHRREVAQ